MKRKELNRNFGVKEYSNWNKSFTRECQQKVWDGKGKNQQTLRYVKENNLILKMDKDFRKKE